MLPDRLPARRRRVWRWSNCSSGRWPLAMSLSQKIWRPDQMEGGWAASAASAKTSALGEIERALAKENDHGRTQIEIFALPSDKRAKADNRKNDENERSRARTDLRTAGIGRRVGKGSGR